MDISLFVDALTNTDPSYHYLDARSSSLGRVPETAHGVLGDVSAIQQMVNLANDFNSTQMITFHMGMSDTGHVVHAEV